MLRKKGRHKKGIRGFTLIEIIVVLAMAGLILLMVFLAIRGAQRSRRDYQRKQDLAQMMVAIETWRSNNQGQNLEHPEDLALLNEGYMSDRKDPSTGENYNLEFYHGGTPHSEVKAPPIGQMDYVLMHVCGKDPGTNDLITDPPNFTWGHQVFAVLVTLENGGTYCLDTL